MSVVYQLPVIKYQETELLSCPVPYHYSALARPMAVHTWVTRGPQESPGSSLTPFPPRGFSAAETAVWGRSYHYLLAPLTLAVAGAVGTVTSGELVGRIILRGGGGEARYTPNPRTGIRVGKGLADTQA